MKCYEHTEYLVCILQQLQRFLINYSTVESLIRLMHFSLVSDHLNLVGNTSHI